jgi:hypothetical protein
MKRFSSRLYTQLENTQVIDVLDPLKNRITGFFKVRDGYRIQIVLDILKLRGITHPPEGRSVVL